MNHHLSPKDIQNACQKLGLALQFPTISYDEPEHWNEEPFIAYRDFIAEQYPRVHQHLESETIGGSMLYHWPGQNPSPKPVLLCAHYDVVPATDEGWHFPPFSGAIEEGYIWGRGALDDKVSMIGILEAVEHLLKQGYQPERSIWLAFGHDEEIGGSNGAAKLGEMLRKKGIQFSTVLDEGMAVTDGIVPGMEKAVALVGTAEKTSLNLEMTVEKEGGHASLPGKTTAIDVLARALVRIRKYSLPAKFCAPVRQMFRQLASSMHPIKGMVLRHPDLFKSLLIQSYEKSPSGNATIRSTVTPTVVKAGEKSNTVPGIAKAWLNVRLLPGDEMRDLVDTLQKVVNDDCVHFHYDAREIVDAKPSSIDTPAFKALEAAIHAVYPESLVAPALVPGTTDSRHYSAIADQVYRFSPIHLNQADLNRIHGINERISIHNFEQVIRFYSNFIEKAANFSS